MDRNRRTPLSDDDRPVDDRIDRKIDDKIDERVDQRIRERLDNEPVSRDGRRPVATEEHPDERTMEERADRFARERSDRIARERAEHEADLRARELADERARQMAEERNRRLDERVDDRANRLADDRLDRRVDDRIDEQVDERIDRRVDNHVEHVAGPTVVSPVSDAPLVERTRPPMVSRIINWVTSVILILLALRLVMQLIGAQTGNAIVSFIYGITDVLVAPFTGIVARPEAAGFDLQTVVAMIGYAIIGFALAKLIDVLTPNRMR